MKKLIHSFVTLLFTAAAFAQTCPPTSLPFIDNFDSPTLDSCWTWIREDTSHWSLTERPGWMRITTQEGSWDFWHSNRNTLLRPKPAGNYSVETRLSFPRNHFYQTAGLALFRDDMTYLDIAVNYNDDGTQLVYFCHNWGGPLPGDSCGSLANSDTVIYLRIEQVAGVCRGFWSTNGVNWILLGRLARDWLAGDYYLCLHAFNGNASQGAPETPADFDYFRVDPLLGTNVCGEVSGVWDSTGSPYYVTCDVTVPAAQTLEIGPGVQVLFTGHYKFNVFGNLQAIGTEQDSIVFTRAFPTEESKWWGIRVIGASDTARLRYCILKYGKAIFSGNAVDDQGGALYARASTLAVDHCTFINNHANAGGGGAYIEGAMYARFTDCAFIGNSTNDSNAGSGAGAIEMHYTTDVGLQRCLFVLNSTLTEGGAVVVDGQDGGSTGICEMSECTFAYNSCRADLAGSCVVGRYAQLSRVWNCIFWDNFQAPIASHGPNVVAGYSDIQSGYPGTGNIDTDPMFMDAANGDFRLQVGSPCIDAGDPNSPRDPDGSVADMGAFPYTHCPPTSLPFVDNFDSPTLDSCWTWIREDASHWSLSERPGWMRIMAQAGPPYAGYRDINNVLSRTFADTNITVTARVDIQPTQTHQMAGLLVYKDPFTFFEIKRDYDYGGQVVMVNNLVAGNVESVHIFVPDDPIHLRIQRTAHAYVASYSLDSLMWHAFGPFTNDLASNAQLRLDLFAYRAPVENLEIPADFDYFRVDPLPGTNVCGDVSGVWDSTGSPYYVNCDVTVPAGQMLEIGPGVQVLFTGHYKFNVFGNLQAIGTEQDSIVFTRAFPTEESKWSGIRFSNVGNVGKLAYCVVEHGHASGGASDNSGGGVYLSQSSPLIEHSSIRNNIADSDGGGMVCIDYASPTVRDCEIEGNTAAFGGGIICRLYSNPLFQRCRILNNSASVGYGGGVHDYLYAVPTFDHCIFAGNTSNWSGAGVQLEEGCGGTFINCTFIGNSTPAEGGAICLTGHSTANLWNCILWDNQAYTSPEIHLWNSSIAVLWSNVSGGYPGTGNIDADPLFVDTSNGDFHLQAESPCIDAGDPNSPLDPDSTRADMGAAPFIHTALMVNPAALHFGLTDLGADSVRPLSLFNPTMNSIAILSVSHALNTFSLDTSGLNGQVLPHAMYVMPVTFGPNELGPYEDTLVIVVQQPDSIYRIPLSGEAQVILPPVDSLVIQRGPLNGIRLDWAAVTHSISGQPVDNVGYIIYGSTSAQGPFVPFGYATTNTYVHPYILNSQAVYFYRVTADVGSRAAR